MSNTAFSGNLEAALRALRPDRRAGRFAPRSLFTGRGEPAEHVMDGLAAVFARVVYHVRRARVHRQEAQLARVNGCQLSAALQRCQGGGGGGLGRMCRSPRLVGVRVSPVIPMNRDRLGADAAFPPAGSRCHTVFIPCHGLGCFVWRLDNVGRSNV